MAANLAPALIGIAGTLVITTYVQAVVVPWVHTRTRRRERWEKDAIELHALLEERLFRQLLDLHATSLILRGVMTLSRDEADPDRRATLDQGVSEAARDRREARRLVGEEMARVSVLHERMKWVNRDSLVWELLTRAYEHLHVAISEAEHDDASDPDIVSDEEFNRRWDQVHGGRLFLKDFVMVYAKTQKPPTRPPLRTRVRRRLRKRWDAVWSGLRRASDEKRELAPPEEPSPSAQDPSPATDGHDADRVTTGDSNDSAATQ